MSIRDGDRHHTARLGIRDVGVICTASIVYEIYQRPAGRPNSLQALFDRLAPPVEPSSSPFTTYGLC
jgi:hypothetical protein